MPARRRKAVPPRTGGCGTLKLATWNVRCARGLTFHAIRRALDSLNVDVAIKQETKITGGLYPRTAQIGGYNIISTDGFSKYSGGVALVWREREHFEVEEQKKIHTNVISARIIAGEHKYYVVGCYCPPGNSDQYLEAWEYAKKKYEQCPRGFLPLAIGDLNLDVNVPRDQNE